MKQFFRNLVIGAATYALALVPALAPAANVSQVPVSPTYSEPSQIVPTLNYLVGTINTQGPGLAPNCLSTVPVTTSQTTIQVLGTCTLPASFLANVGQGVRITCLGNGTATGTNTLTLQFGSATAFAVSPGATTAATMKAVGYITKSGASTQQMYIDGQYNVTPVTAVITSATQTDTAAIAITCSGTSTTSANFTLVGMFVEVLK